MRGRRLTVAILLGVAGLSCAPSLGPFRLPAARGRVVDVGSGAPVPDAEVIQWWRGRRGASDAYPVYHARFTRADAAGRFAFPAELVASPRIWLLRTDGPSWGVWAESHGFQRPRPVGDGDETLLRLGPADAAARRASVAPFCDRTPEDAGARRVAALACPEREHRMRR